MSYGTNTIQHFIRIDNTLGLRLALRDYQHSSIDGLQELFLFCSKEGTINSLKEFIRTDIDITGINSDNRPFFAAITHNNRDIITWYCEVSPIYKVLFEFIKSYNEKTIIESKVLLQPADYDLLVESRDFVHLNIIYCPFELQELTQKFFNDHIDNIYKVPESVIALFKLLCLKY